MRHPLLREPEAPRPREGAAGQLGLRRGEGLLCEVEMDLAGLPLVGDVAALLPRLLEANEPFFATERYDGGDGRVSFEIDPSAAESFPQGGARG